jgi:hypothetical protein
MRITVMVDQVFHRQAYRCRCEFCQLQPAGETALDHQAINRVLATLDEKQRRLFAGLLAHRRGHGGILIVAAITGLSRSTIRRGIAELRNGTGPAQGRVRNQGGGRKRIEKKLLRW